MARQSVAFWLWLVCLSRQLWLLHSHRAIWSQIDFMTGWGGFPDQRLHGDSAALSESVEELFVLQTQNTPTMRVPDLANPYTTSVQLLPTSQFNSRVIGSELNFEPLPRR